MAEPSPDIEFAKLPAPSEGILVALFITDREVARSRDFYSRLLGGAAAIGGTASAGCTICRSVARSISSARPCTGSSPTR